MKEVSSGEQELGVNKDGKNLFFSKRLEVPFNILKCIFLFYCVSKGEKWRINTQLDNETFSSKDKRFTWQRPFMVAGKNECLVEVECLQCVFVLFKPKKAGEEELSNHVNIFNNLDWAEQKPTCNQRVNVWSSLLWSFITFSHHTMPSTLLEMQLKWNLSPTYMMFLGLLHAFQNILSCFTFYQCTLDLECISLLFL